MTIGQYLIKRLQDYRIRDMFGIPGDYVLSFYSMLEESPINVVGATREDCAGFAADAYAKLTGRVGVCDATLGPGATNLVTGLVESLLSHTLGGDYSEAPSKKPMCGCTEHSHDEVITAIHAHKDALREVLQWHLQNDDQRQAGFDAWCAVSRDFKSYNDPILWMDGKRRELKGYLPDGKSGARFAKPKEYRKYLNAGNTGLLQRIEI